MCFKSPWSLYLILFFNRFVLQKFKWHMFAAAPPENDSNWMRSSKWTQGWSCRKKLIDLEAGSGSVPTSLCGLNPVRNQAKQLLRDSSDFARLCSPADQSEILDNYALCAGKSCRLLTSHDDTNTQHHMFMSNNNDKTRFRSKLHTASLI